VKENDGRSSQRFCKSEIFKNFAVKHQFGSFKIFERMIRRIHICRIFRCSVPVRILRADSASSKQARMCNSSRRSVIEIFVFYKFNKHI
jgi:hypothetical protein